MELYPLLDGESIELRAMIPGEERVAHRTFVGSWDEVEDLAARWELDYDVYFGVAPRVPDSEGNLKGKTGNIARCPVVWLDLDAKGTHTKESRLKQLEEAPPSFLVDSGHGFHAYYRLDRDLEPQIAKHLMEAMAAHFDCDVTADPTRVLRWPGTKNHKDPENPVFVDLIRQSSNGTWNPEALPKAQIASSQHKVSGTEKRARIIETFGIDKSGSTVEDEEFTGRDAAMFELACYYRNQGWEQDTTLARLLEVNEKNRPPLQAEEIKGKVRSAFSWDAPPKVVEVIEAPPVLDIEAFVSAPRSSVAQTTFKTVSIHELGEPVRPVYLWEPYFLLNRLVLFDGEEGIGKGLLLCLLAARYSKDFPFVWFTAEDDPQDDIKPRIRAALSYYGLGSMSDVNVHFVSGDPRFNAQNSALFDMLESTLESLGARVLVFDPGRSFIGPQEGQKDFSYNNEADIRPTMQRLNKTSRDLEVAVPFVHHHNKNAAAPLRYRTTGTGAWRQVVRHQVTMLWDHTMDDGVFGVQKSNLGPTGSVRPYKLEIVDGYAVLVPGDDLAPEQELEIWAQNRAKQHKGGGAITVMEPDEIVEKVRDWAFSNLASGEDFPSRAELMKAVGLGQEPVRVAMQTLREEGWVVRPKGRQGGGYIWVPKWQPGDV